jgi:hypothetical protein
MGEGLLMDLALGLSFYIPIFSSYLAADTVWLLSFTVTVYENSGSQSM